MYKYDSSERAARKRLSRSRKDRNPIELCLCACCANQFYSSPGFYIERIDPYQVDKDVCTFCNYRPGFDYLVFSLLAVHSSAHSA